MKTIPPVLIAAVEELLTRSEFSEVEVIANINANGTVQITLKGHPHRVTDLIDKWNRGDLD